MKDIIIMSNRELKFKIQLLTQTETGEDIQELACLERETEGLEVVDSRR